MSSSLRMGTLVEQIIWVEVQEWRRLLSRYYEQKDCKSCWADNISKRMTTLVGPILTNFALLTSSPHFKSCSIFAAWGHGSLAQLKSNNWHSAGFNAPFLSIFIELLQVVIIQATGEQIICPEQPAIKYGSQLFTKQSQKYFSDGLAKFRGWVKCCFSPCHGITQCM